MLYLEWVGVTEQDSAGWSRGSGCFLVAGSDAWRGPDWGAARRRRRGTQGKCQTNVKYTSSMAGSEGWKFPVTPLVFLPPACKSSLSPLLLFPPPLPHCLPVFFPHYFFPLGLASAWTSSQIVLVRRSAGVSSSIFTWLFSTGLIGGC